MTMEACYCLNPFHFETLQTGTLTNSEYPDKMPLDVALGYVLFAKIKIQIHIRGSNASEYLEISVCDHLKYRMGIFFKISNL